MLLVSFSPEVITLSGFRCMYKIKKSNGIFLYDETGSVFLKQFEIPIHEDKIIW
jgi:hypothetical protein